MNLRVIRGNGRPSTPYRSQFYVVDENGRTGAEGKTKYHRGWDRKGDAERALDRRLAEEAKPSPDEVGELTAADERILRTIAAYGYQRIGEDVSEEAARRIVAHGRARRTTRTTVLPGHRRIDFEVLEEVER